MTKIITKFLPILTLACVVAIAAAHAQEIPRVERGNIAVAAQTVASGLSSPIDLVSAPGGTSRLFIAEQTGKIRVLKNGALLATPFLDLSGRIFFSGESGLLSVAFHPGLANPNSPGYRKFYTYGSEPVSGAADFTVPFNGTFSHQGVLAEWQVSAGNPDVADPASRREILRLDEPQSNHNGCKLAFRASDGYLYLSLGDGGGGNDTAPGHTANGGNGQSIDTVLGKMLRINPLASGISGSADAVSANGKYRVPGTNPFVGRAGVDEIYAIGFRNPFRFSFDAATDSLILGDVGQASVEEVDLVERGKNYGWNRKEGSFLFNPANAAISVDTVHDPAYTDPVAEYGHHDGVAIIGGFIYRGAAIPALAGKYVFGDFSNPETGTGRLFYTELSTGVIESLPVAGVDGLSASLKSIGQDATGELYALVGTTAVKLTPIPVAPALVNLSTRARIETGDNVLIGGFIVNGSTPKNFIVRELGPSLSVGGTPIPGSLADPSLELRDSEGVLIAANNDWMTSPQAQQVRNEGLAPSDPHESAIFASLAPGAYTAIARGAGNTSGIGLVELYDVAQDQASNATNISSRGRVQSGDNVMIAGFIVGGTTSQRILLRGLGPSLGAQGIANPLADPSIELHNESGAIVASNDNWRSTQEADIQGTDIAPTDDKEAALITTLPQGRYTAIVRGAGTSTGVALIEVYRLDP